jgi:hypothetical protein
MLRKNNSVFFSFEKQTGLYPFVQKTKPYPLGAPKIFT